MASAGRIISLAVVAAAGTFALGAIPSARAQTQTPVQTPIQTPTQTPGPRMNVSPATTKIGDRVTVALEAWPATTATVAVCGNAARRGSQDCDLRGAQAIKIHDGTTLVEVTVAPPPVGCPCVVRASTPSSDLVQVGAITVEGVPGGTDIAPPSAGTGDQLQVTAVVVEADTSWTQELVAGFAGTAHQRLRLRIANNGEAQLTGLRVNAAVGRSRTDAEPIGARDVGPIAAHATTTVTIPFEIAAPAFGDYVVTGKVYGPGQPVQFSADADNDPWALWLLVPIALIVIAELLRAKERRRRQRAQQQAPVRPQPAPVVAFADCSPDVGVRVPNGWTSAPYDPISVRDAPQHSDASSSEPLALHAGR